MAGVYGGVGVSNTVVKFCKAEHDPSVGAKLRIGNLFEYRSIENAELKDQEEGTYEFSIEIDGPVELPLGWANALLPGFHFGGGEVFRRPPGSIDAKVEIARFASRVGNMLRRQVKLDNYGWDLSKLTIENISQSRIEVRYGPIKYRDRNLVLSEHSEQDVDQLLRTYFDVAFCKPPSFFADQEFRFVFTPVAGNTVGSVCEKDVYLDCNYLFGSGF